MPRGRKAAISAHINTQSKATLCLVFSDFLPTIHEIPYVDPAINGSTREKLSILAESYGPEFSCLIAVCDLPIFSPFGGFRNAPYLDFAPEADTSCFAPVARGRDVVAAELMGGGECLDERELGIGRGVDFDRGCA